jgi:uncharacterized membrane protein YvlD (DUF360 family)
MTLLMHLGVNLIIVAVAHWWTSDVMVVAPPAAGAAGLLAVAVVVAIVFAVANMLSLRVTVLVPGLFAFAVNVGLLVVGGWLVHRAGCGLLAASPVAVAWAAVVHTVAHLVVALLGEAGYFSRPARSRPNSPRQSARYTEY